jgi:hypothetical protein
MPLSAGTSVGVISARRFGALARAWGEVDICERHQAPLVAMLGNPIPRLT